MNSKKPSYYVWDDGKWVKCKRAAEQAEGWLHYELSDGTNGLTYNKPGGLKKWAKGFLGSHNTVYPISQEVQ